jgi:hypothetical protein
VPDPGPAAPAGPAGEALVRPRYGESSLADILPGVLAGLGAGGPDPLGLATGPLAGARAVVVLLIDGLGHHLLPAAGAVAPTLARLMSGGDPGSTYRPITAGFPSTTPTSLASLGTGAPPGAHGLVGFTVRIPETGIVLNHLEWRDDPAPATWQPLPTQFERAAAAGLAARVVSRPEFEGSGLTVAAYRGGRYAGAGDLEALGVRLVAELRAAAGPTVIYGYHPDVDRAGHVHGVASPQWRAAVAAVDQFLAVLVDGLPAGCAIVVTADHGQIDIPSDHRFDMDTDLRLRSGVTAVAGEARVRYLHTEPGAAADVQAVWSGILGPAAWVASRDDAIDDGWFGPVAPAHRERIGDLVVVCHDDSVILRTASESARVSAFVGFHGSATPAEMMIPLMVVRR